MEKTKTLEQQNLFAEKQEVQSRKFLTAMETAKFLGISKSTLYFYSSQKKLTYYKLQNRKLYFLIDDLNEFVINPKNRVSSKQEIDKEVSKVITKKRKGGRHDQ